MISEELLQSFIAEASDLLDDIEPSLVEYSRQENVEERTEIVNRVFRHFHSIKGSAGFVGLHDIAKLTHEAETLLEQYRKAPDKIISQHDITLLCRTVDLLREIFTAGGESVDAEGNDIGIDSLISEIITATRLTRSSLTSIIPKVDSKKDYQPDNRVGFNAEARSEGKSPTNAEPRPEVNPPPAMGHPAAKDEDFGPDATQFVPHSSVIRLTDAAKESVHINSGPAPTKPGKTTIVDTSHRRSDDSRTRRRSSDTARIIKTKQLVRSEKVDNSEFAAKYVTEANELLEQIEHALLQAEQHPDSAGESVQEALRCLHSFKGNSGFMNLSDLERLSHRMESEVENNIGRTLGLDSQTFDALLQMIDVLRQGVLDYSCGGSGAIPETDAYIAMMDEFSTAHATATIRKAPDTEVIPIGDRRNMDLANYSPPQPASPPPPAEPPAAEAGSIKTVTGAGASPVSQPANPVLQHRVNDTTRMVLRGASSDQVNLRDAPKHRTIVMDAPLPGDAEIRDPILANSQSDTTKRIKKMLTPAAVLAGAELQDNPEPKRKSSSDTTAKIALSKKLSVSDAASGAGEPGKSSPDTAPVATGKSHSDTGAKRRSADAAAARNDIRVDLRKLDSMLDLVGELVIAEAMVTRHPVVWNADNESLERAVHQLRRVASSLQDMATSVRMIPLAPTFRRMTRLVYDLSVKAGKQVDLILLGEETEVDRTVIERISDPLVHIIRNAIDHGIESPEERINLGKPETGRLTIEGHHEGGEVWIVITDDGRGLDRAAIVKRAISRGLIQGDGTDLSDSQVYHFIFEPGFSTASKVTDISGRGFGMDVVKKNIEKLSGRIDIRTRPGEGTAVVLRIPLTLAIIDGMLVSSGDTRYIIPLLSIRESLRPEPAQIMSTPDGQQMVKLREELIPIVKLDETFSRVKSARDLMEGILMIVEGEDGEVIALFADELLGQQETVIKGLSGWLKRSRGVSGCTILGDGEVGLILDIGAIVNLARQRSAQWNTPKR